MQAFFSFFRNWFQHELETQQIDWQHNPDTSDPNFPYVATHNNQRLKLRVNDFPKEPLYTLFIDGKKVTNVQQTPETWNIPIAVTQNSNTP